VDEVRIHRGTHVKLKKVDEDALPADFLAKLRELAHREERVQAVYLFALENADTGEEQVCLALGMSRPLLGRRDDEFLRVVEEIQIILPAELPVNLYRLDASPQVARFCLESLEPVYLRTAAWREKQLKRLR